MTCEDCVHYDICLNAFTHRGMYIGDDAEKMECFKNKADYVEVVRCKECKHLTVHNSPTLYAYCEKEHIRFEPFQKDTRTHYCSYGDRGDT